MPDVQFFPDVRENPPVNSREYKVVRLALLLTGMSFRQYGRYSTEWDRFQLIRLGCAIVYLLFALYISFRIVVVMLMHDESPDASGMTQLIMGVLLYLKAFVSMIFLFYWELRSRNQYAMELTLNLRPEQMFARKRNDWPKYLAWVGFALIIVLRLASRLILVVGHATDKHRGHQRQFVDYELYSAPFGRQFGSGCTIVFVLHSFLVDYTALFVFLMTSFSLRYRVLFLKCELEQLGEGGKYETTVGFYEGFRNLMLVIQNVLNHFQFYRVIELISSVGILGIAVICFTLIGHKEWYDFLLLIMEVAIQTVAIFLLIYPASAIYNTVNNVKGIIYFNTNLWKDYNQHIYELSKLYTEMAALTLQEISVWGFSMAKKKPLCVTGSFIGTLFFVLYTKVLAPSM
ncbi:hypothetical protein M3Y99_00303300 [Aphelenchoides fujianensis]|nr:hypothetical protein M3Y99_00303300 [Aphelenchoides fujianensis]